VKVKKKKKGEVNQSAAVQQNQSRSKKGGANSKRKDLGKNNEKTKRSLPGWGDDGLNRPKNR